MSFLPVALGIFAGGAVLNLLTGRRAEHHYRALLLGQIVLIAGGLATLALAAEVFISPPPASAPLYNLPLLGPVIFGLDALSAFFMLPLGLFSIICGLAARPHLRDAEKKRRPGLYWFFTCMLPTGMLLVLSAASGFFFILAWEVMSLAPFFIILLHRNSVETRSAAWIYLVMAHIGALLLMLFFALLGAEAGGISFSSLAAFGQNSAPLRAAGPLFVMALAGFGIKCGFVPLQLWLPSTYAAMPDHVTPLLGGAMINMGLYGLLRSLQFLGPLPLWCVYLLIGTGLLTAFMGILLALAQSNIKHSLAYSSAENMGIAALGLGFGLLGLQSGRSDLAALAFCGALLHLLNHSVFKGLLFLCAGNIQRQAKTCNLNYLGGLQKRMPLTSFCFAVGCLALGALPPLNGFAGEFLIYMNLALGGQGGVINAQAFAPAWLYWLGLFIMALVGGLVLLTFTKTYALSFLGNPRHPLPGAFEDAPSRLPGLALFLALLCMALGLGMPWLLPLLTPVLAAMPGFTPQFTELVIGQLDQPHSLLHNISIIFVAVYAALAVLGLARRRLLRKRPVRESLTWDCGYVLPSSHMQYSSASFTDPATRIMKFWLKPRWVINSLRQYFPPRIRADLQTPDFSLSFWQKMLFQTVNRLAFVSKRLQHGLLNAYILYIFLALLATLTWRLW